MENSVNVYEIDGVSKSYGDRTIFNDLNMTIKGNEIFCISGASGSGKSTLLNMLGMLDVPDSGRISICGAPLPKISSKKGRMLLKNNIFYVFQNFALIEDSTISENLDIPMAGRRMSGTERSRLKRDALEKVGLSCDLSKKVYTLSGGEQQRVAIARGFLRDFDILLADEPTGSLDAANRNGVMDLFEQFKALGKTVIIVTHDEIIKKRCDVVFELDAKR